MDFSKTSIHQRTRSNFQKLYSELNEKRKAERLAGGGDGGESVGDGSRERVGGVGKGLRRSDRNRVVIDVESHSIRKGVKGKRKGVKGKRELGKIAGRGKNVSRGRRLIDEFDDDVDLSKSSVRDGRKSEIQSCSGSGKSEKSGFVNSESTVPDADRMGGNKKVGENVNKIKNVSTSGYLDESFGDDHDDVELSKSSGRNGSKSKTVRGSGSGKKFERGFSKTGVSNGNSLKGERVSGKVARSCVNRIGDDSNYSKSFGTTQSTYEIEGGYGKIEKKLARGLASERTVVPISNDCLRGKRGSREKFNRNKAPSTSSSADESDDGVKFLGDEVEVGKSWGRNQSTSDCLRRKRASRETFNKNKTPTISSSESDDDGVKFLGDEVAVGKSCRRNQSKSEINRGSEEMEKFGRGSAKRITSASVGDCSKGNGKLAENSNKETDETISDSSVSISGSSGYSVDESEDDEGVTYLGDAITHLDDHAPSNSSRVEGNEVKVGFAELKSLEVDDDSDGSQGSESTREDNDDSHGSESSEEDDDDSSDKDFTATSSTSSSDSEDESENIEEEEEEEEEVEENLVDPGVSRRRACDRINKTKTNDSEFKNRTDGMDHLLDHDKGSNKESTGLASDLHSLSVPLSKSNKKLKLGADWSIPIEVSDELGSSSEYEDDGGNGSYHRKLLQRTDGKGSGKAGKTTGIQHNPLDVNKILTDSLREGVDGDKLLEKYVSPEVTAVNKVLSYKFKFEHEEEVKPERSESDKNVDDLFDEMNMCLQLLEIGSSGASALSSHLCQRKAVVVDDADFSTEESDQATLCSQGKHRLVLDDQFGIICRFCSHVEMEIRDILPPLSKNPGGGRDRYDFEKADNIKFSDLQWQDNGHEYPYGSKRRTYEKGTVWDLIPGVYETMYSHQQEGFEFIWKKIAGGIHIEKLEKRLPDGGSGCIISHAPGTGKTRLTIVFLQAFMTMYPTARPLIIAPRCMLLTWEEEFKKWNAGIKFHNLNKPELFGNERSIAAKLGGGKDQHFLRLMKLVSWKNEASVLGISYRLFEQLGGEGRNEDDIRRTLLRVPTLLVLDEGHTPRNNQTLVWKALSNVKTKRCIILSGTPFQNNFEELYNTLCLVNPLLSFGIPCFKGAEFSRKRGRKSHAARGQWDSITSSVRKNQQKLAQLRGVIDPFVHIYKGNILRENLPGLRDALVVLKPTEMQQMLLGRLRGLKCSVEIDHIMSLISVHPSLLPKQDKEAFSSMIKDLESPHAGVKTNFLIKLIQLSGALNEKVLVFSQYIKPLAFIKELLKATFRWVEGREFLYMDGQQEEKLRQSSINNLNDPKSEVKVLLASLKACSEGINLVGASRVVLLDVHWNPSVERQAISRAYRLGQKKFVYVYHLVTGSMEGEKYVRQVEKSHLSELVFSSRNASSSDRKISSTVYDDKILEAMVQDEKLQNIFDKVIYQPKDQDLIETFGLVDSNADWLFKD